jgi:hypothetical protein
MRAMMLVALGLGKTEARSDAETVAPDSGSAGVFRRAGTDQRRGTSRCAGKRVVDFAMTRRGLLLAYRISVHVATIAVTQEHATRLLKLTNQVQAFQTVTDDTRPVVRVAGGKRRVAGRRRSGDHGKLTGRPSSLARYRCEPRPPARVPSNGHAGVADRRPPGGRFERSARRQPSRRQHDPHPE